MLKKIIVAVATVVVEVFASFLTARRFEISFVESAFFIGIFGTFILYLFNTSGGFSTDLLDGKIQGMTGVKMNKEDFIFKGSIALTVSLVFLISMSISVWIVYFL